MSTKPERFSVELKVILDDLYTRHPVEAQRIETALATHALVELLGGDLARTTIIQNWGPDFWETRRAVLLEVAGVTPAAPAFHPLFAPVSTGEFAFVKAWLRGVEEAAS